MAALASPADLGKRWRPLSDGELLAADAFLMDVSAVIRSRVPGVDERIAADPNYAALVVKVVTGSVLRTLRNPDGKIQESLDDYAYRRADAVADGSLYVSESDLALLRAGRTGVGSVRLVAHGEL